MSGPLPLATPCEGLMTKDETGDNDDDEMTCLRRGKSEVKRKEFEVNLFLLHIITFTCFRSLSPLIKYPSYNL